MDKKRMTKYEGEEMVCPKCGKSHFVKKYVFINVVEKPEMKQDILGNKIFYFSCDGCGLKAPMTYDSIYLDSKKKLMVMLAPTAGEKQKREMDSWKDDKKYTRRYVDNINDLKEKIMIAENHLDDRVIELVKIEYLRQMEKEMKDDTLMNILFDYSGNDLCFLVFFEKKGIGKIPLSLEFYRQMESRYIKRLGSRFTDDFVKVDMEWAGNLMFHRN